jgi:hypothetical protein
MRKMLSQRRPSPALIIACIALFAAIGGTSIALPGSNTVDKNDLQKNVVKNKNIRKNAVSSGKIRRNAVTAAKIKDQGVGNPELRNGAVNSPKLANNSVNKSKLAAGSVTGAKLGPTVVRTGDSPPTADADGASNSGQVGIAIATAQCNQGERLLSGGAQWTTGGTPPVATKQLFLRDSHPTANGWRAVGNVDFGAQGQATLRAYAVCLR